MTFASGSRRFVAEDGGIGFEKVNRFDQQIFDSECIQSLKELNEFM